MDKLFFVEKNIGKSFNFQEIFLVFKIGNNKRLPKYMI